MDWGISDWSRGSAADWGPLAYPIGYIPPPVEHVFPCNVVWDGWSSSNTTSTPNTSYAQWVLEYIQHCVTCDIYNGSATTMGECVENANASEIRLLESDFRLLEEEEEEGETPALARERPRRRADAGLDRLHSGKPIVRGRRILSSNCIAPPEPIYCCWSNGSSESVRQSEINGTHAESDYCCHGECPITTTTTTSTTTTPPACEIYNEVTYNESMLNTSGHVVLAPAYCCWYNGSNLNVAYIYNVSDYCCFRACSTATTTTTGFMWGHFHRPGDENAVYAFRDSCVPEQR